MIKFLYFLIIILFVNHCSFDTKSGIWTQDQKIDKISKINVQKLFEKKVLNENEFNKDLILKISNNDPKINQISNNDYGILDFDLELKKISKYKFSKIDYFNQFEPELVFFNKDLIFFDNRGSIIRFNNDSKIVWKKNHYKKFEKKLKPILSLSGYQNSLLITDSLSKYYLVDINSGKLLWMKDHETNFISDIKIDDNKFYVLDSNNNFLCFSLLNGDKLWEFKSEQKLINSQKKTSIILDNSSVFFNNSRGEIVALDKENGQLIWLTSTIKFDDSFQSFLHKTSKLVLNNNSIYFSNNADKFYSLDLKTGIINWTQSINSLLKPIIVDNIIFTISSSGYLYIIEKDSGNIIRVTDSFSNFKSRKRKNVQPTGFIIGKKEIFISTNIGQIIVVNTATGKVNLTYKVSRNKISEPYVSNKNLYVVKDNEILRLN